MISIRRTLTAAAITGSGLAAAAGGLAPAAHAATPPARPDGYSTVIGCTGATGAISYTPGLRRGAPRPTTGGLSAGLSGCADAYGNTSGAGTLSVRLAGTSGYRNVHQSGSFVINWPSFYNPSTGTLAVAGPNADGSYTVTGTVTGGAFTSAAVSTTLFPTTTNPGATGRKGHLLTTQNFLNAAPLTLQENFG